LVRLYASLIYVPWNPAVATTFKLPLSRNTLIEHRNDFPLRVYRKFQGLDRAVVLIIASDYAISRSTQCRRPTYPNRVIRQAQLARREKASL
jgi:hypothetical protein